MFNQAWFIAKRDLIYMLRQRETLVWVFIMPLLFFWFIGTVTGGGGVMGPSFDKRYKLAIDGPQTGGFMLEELYKALDDEHFDLVFPPAAATVAPQSEEGTSEEATLEDYTRRLVVPVGFTESVQAHEEVKLRFVRDGGGNAGELDKLRISRAAYGLLADLVVLEANGIELSADTLRSFHDEPRALSLAVESAGERLTIPSGYSQTIPGTMVMFTMMLLLTSGAILLVTEREQGLLRRLAATPIPRSAVVLGKWMGKMALAIVQIAFAMVAGRLMFGMDWGESLPMVCLVVFSWAAFCASLAIVLANLARTEAQMTGMGVMSTMVLAALGGCWWPIEITADWMQSLANWLPTGWTMNAMHQLVNFGNPASSAVGAVTALLVGALVLGWWGARSFRYQ